jgi:hypothetical protein
MERYDVKSLMRVLAIGTLLNLSAASAAEAPGAAPTAPVGPPAAGITLYGAHVMRYTQHDPASATAHFTPPLPWDNTLLFGAMQTVARAAYGQHGLVATDAQKLKPRLGQAIRLRDPGFEYLFVLDGSEDKGVDTIRLSRKEIPLPLPPAAVPTPPLPLPAPAAAVGAPPQPQR